MTRWLAWGLWLAIVGTFPAVVVTGAAAEDGEGSAVAYTFFVGVFATMGALVASRQPRNPIGWILLGRRRGVHDRRADDHARRRAKAAAPVLVHWLRPGCGWPASGRSPPSACCCSPTGTCRRRAGGRSPGSPPPRSSSTGAVIAFKPGPFEDATVENPLGLDAIPGFIDVLENVSPAALALAILGSIASLFVRFRRARNVERQQLKWLSYTGALVGVALIVAMAIETVVGDRAVDLTTRSSRSRSHSFRWRWASRSCATACTTSTSSSTARWSTAR